MNKFKLALIVLACIAFSCGDKRSAGPNVAHVIIIGVDAMSPAGISNAHTPVLDKLMKDGAYTLHARGILPTSSSPNWESMISGSAPFQHSVTTNSWEKDDHVLPAHTISGEGLYPTIFSTLREQRPECEIGAIYQWKGFGRLFQRSVLSYDSSPANEEETAKDAIKYLSEKRPAFCFIHLDHVDHAGHHYGHGTPEYYSSISKADSLIGKIISALEQNGMMDETLIMISADHGGIGFGHGGETLDEIEIPLILYGKGVKKGYNIKEPVYIFDHAATAAFALGINQPEMWIGRPTLRAFQGYESQLQYPMQEFVTKPKINPIENPFGSGGLFIEKTPEVSITNVSNKGVVRFTVDGSDPNASSAVYQKPFTLDSTCVVKAAVFEDTVQISQQSLGYFRILSRNPTVRQGVTCLYFETENLKEVPKFSLLKPKKVSTIHEFNTKEIQFDRAENIAVQFKSYIKIDKPGEYIFYLASDDGSKLFVNDSQVVNNDGNHGVLERSGKIELEKGIHSIEVEWYNAGGGSFLGAYYKGPGIPKQIIPANKLYLQR